MGAGLDPSTAGFFPQTNGRICEAKSKMMMFLNLRISFFWGGKNDDATYDDVL